MKVFLNKKYLIGIIFSFVLALSTLFSNFYFAKAERIPGAEFDFDPATIQSYKVTLDSRSEGFTFNIRNLGSAMYDGEGKRTLFLEYETIEANFEFAEVCNYVSRYNGEETRIFFNRVSGANSFNFFQVGYRNRFTFRKNMSTFFAERAKNNNGELNYGRFLVDKVFDENLSDYTDIGVRFTLKDSTVDYKITLLVKCYDSAGNDLGVYCDSGEVVEYDWKDYDVSPDSNPEDNPTDPNPDLNDEQNNLEVKKKFDFLRFFKILLSIVLPVSLVVLFLSFVKKKKKYKR